MYSKLIVRSFHQLRKGFSSRAISKKDKLSSGSVKEKAPLIVTPENQYEILSDVVTPYWHLDYAEQLVLKKNWIKEIAAEIKSHRIPKCRTTVLDIIPSPVIESYRNKDEFSIRCGVDGNPKTVGFFIGSPAEGETICVPPIKLISLKEEHIRLSQVYQEIIRSSPLKACHDLHDGGFWRNFIVRSNQKGDIMCIATCHPNGATEEEMDRAKEFLRDSLLKACPTLYSLYFQACPNVKCSSAQAPFVLLHGQEYLYENYDGLTVRMSPDSFSQVNTEAALLMYKTTLKMLNISNKTTILDLCCGNGPFSLIASKSVRGCIGIEHIGQAIEDAKFNASYNEISNCEFYSGSVEKKVGPVLSTMDSASDLVPILNPGRAGIGNEVIRKLRKSLNIRRLAYISCKADAARTIRNFLNLCSTTFDDSPPFHLTMIQGVDLFPQTPHCELILLFHR